MPDLDLPSRPGIPRPDIGALLARARRGVGRRNGPKDVAGIDRRTADLPIPTVDVRRADVPRAIRRSEPTGPILGAVVVGVFVGIWLATWPETADRLRAIGDRVRAWLEAMGAAGPAGGGVRTTGGARGRPGRPAGLARWEGRPGEGLEEARVEAGVPVGPGRPGERPTARPGPAGDVGSTPDHPFPPRGTESP